MAELSGIIGSVVGILGFVMGYYFKSFDHANNPATPPERHEETN